MNTLLLSFTFFLRVDLVWRARRVIEVIPGHRLVSMLYMSGFVTSITIKIL